MIEGEIVNNKDFEDDTAIDIEIKFSNLILVSMQQEI